MAAGTADLTALRTAKQPDASLLGHRTALHIPVLTLLAPWLVDVKLVGIKPGLKRCSKVLTSEQSKA